MRKLKKWLNLPFSVKCMLAEALILSGWHRYAMLHRPFAQIAPTLGCAGQESSPADVRKALCAQVAWAVRAACSRTPWESPCMVRAMTAKRMLARRGIPCTLYMGVRKGEHGGMEAHAWTRAGSLYITGGNGSLRYTVTNSYATPAKAE